MIARELISDAIPALKTSDTGADALDLMNDYHVAHLPIVNNEQLLGLISEEDILNLNEVDEAIGNHKLSPDKQSIFELQHVYDVIKVMSDYHITVLPVLDDQGHYTGSITLDKVVQFLAELAAVKEPGGIIVLHLNIRDYSLAEIARIVESNGSVILSCQIASIPSSTKMSVTIKVNTTDMRNIIATFERFEYQVTIYYQESDVYDDLKERYDSLIRYLNI